MLNGQRLAVARLRRGHTKRTLAAALGVTERTVFNWERGEIAPDMFTSQKIAEFLQYPEEFFTKADLHIVEPETVSFRSMKSMRASQRDASIAACSLAVEVNDWLEKNYSLPTQDIPDLSDCSPEVAAVTLRQSWVLGERPVKNMIHLLESKGVRVFSLAQDCVEVDACSTWVSETPFVFLNSFKSAERSRFDAAHELGHLCLHRHGAPNGREAELEADTFARHFLMPESAVRAKAPSFINMAALFQVKKYWTVSVAAAAYHLHKCALISDWHYRQLAIEIQNRGYRKEEPEGARRESSLLWSKICTSLRDEGKGQAWLANQLSMPSSELSDLLFGLTTTMVPDTGTQKHYSPPRRGHLSLVSGGS